MIPEEKNLQAIIHRKTETRSLRNWRHWFIGRPLATADAPHQTIGKLIGLAVFASDALSSNAYATQEILIILAAAGTAAFGYVFPISMVIVLLLTIVTISYQQVIHAYPDGGGAYIVAKDNLGELPALIATAALLTDYVLTVSVSVSSGVAQIVSAYPTLYEYRIVIAVGFVLFVMLINLRGVVESGFLFAIPSYFFILMMFITLATGFVRLLSGSLGAVLDPPEMNAAYTVAAVTPFLLLHAFSSGTAALTGIEAISNGITAFKEPRSRNAATVLIWMAIILSSLFLGISFLSGRIGAVPSEAETIISQLARTVYAGRGTFYLFTILGTTVILMMAANTAFAGFPRLSALTAADGYLPRQLTYKGSRLVYSYGIFALALIASLLIILFQASVTRLIPLYAIGVFLSFTLAQFGMARRWWKQRPKTSPNTNNDGKVEGSRKIERGWFFKMTINGFGALCTCIVMMIFAITKFHDGAWMVLILMSILVMVFYGIRKHYRSLSVHLSLNKSPGTRPYSIRHRVIMPIGGVHQGTLEGLRYAQRLSDDITAVHVSIDPDETEKLLARWDKWGDGVRLVILESPYRQFLEPILTYIKDINNKRQPNEVITIIVPQFIPSRRWEKLLHTNTANLLREELLSKPGIIVTDVPYQVP